MASCRLAASSLFVTLLAMAPAFGQAIHKCTHPVTGKVAYSSSPCPATAEEWRREFDGTGNPNDRDRMSAAEANARIASYERQARPAQAVRVSNAGRSASQGGVIPVTGGSQCRDAKARRDRLLYEAGPRPSIEYRRALDKEVQAACKF